MTALATNRNTINREPGAPSAVYEVAASTHIYKGALVALSATGFAVPAADTAGLVVVGVALEEQNNTGADGALEVEVKQGVVGLANSGTAAVVQATVGRPCYVADDQTVAASSTKSIPAGIVMEIDGSTVYVAVFPGLPVDGVASTHAIETVTSGAVSVYTRTSLISVTGTVAYTLAAGVYEGQRKSLRVTVAASTPDGTLTPAAFADGTSLDLDAVNESVELEYHATGGWRVVHLVGATINA